MKPAKNGCYKTWPPRRSLWYPVAMPPRIDDELMQALAAHHGLMEADGKVVVMSMAVYRQILGVGSDEELAQSLEVNVTNKL